MSERIEYVSENASLDDEYDLDEFIGFLQEMRAKIPAGFSGRLQIADWEGRSVFASIYYIRPETEEDRRNDALALARNSRFIEDRERAELERLKAKYEPDGS